MTMTPAVRHLAEPDVRRIATAQRSSVTAALTLLLLERRGRPRAAVQK
ncbi:MAG: hypothetical protein ACRDZ4_16725 [Egibacteraceae bacterium]